MATPKGLFDPEMVLDDWFDESQQPVAWFDEDLIDTGATGVIGTASQSVTVAQSAAGVLAIQGSASQSVAVAQSAAATLALQATASQAVIVSQSASGTLTASAISGDATQAVVVSQTAAAALAIQAGGNQPVIVSQSASGALAVQGTEAAAVIITQVASGSLALQASASQPILVIQEASGASELTTTGNAEQSIVITQAADASLADARRPGGGRAPRYVANVIWHDDPRHPSQQIDTALVLEQSPKPLRTHRPPTVVPLLVKQPEAPRYDIEIALLLLAA